MGFLEPTTEPRPKDLESVIVLLASAEEKVIIALPSPTPTSVVSTVEDGEVEPPHKTLAKPLLIISIPAPEPSNSLLSKRKSPKEPLVHTSIITGNLRVFGRASMAADTVANTFLLSIPQSDTVNIKPSTDEAGYPAISYKKSSRSSKS